MSVRASTFLGAELVNNGLVEINHRFTIDKSGAAHVNNNDINLLGAGNWTLTQAAGGTFTQTGTASISIPAGLFGLVQGGTFTADPGATVGPGELRFQNVSVDAMTLSATTVVAVFQGGVTATNVINNGGTLIARNNPNSLTDYTSGVGSLLQIDPKDIGAVAALTIANGFTNDGTIDFRESGGGHNTNERLDVTTGAITNSATGVIRSAVGVGTGFHFLGAELVNDGLVEINHRFTIDKSGAAHVNNNDINLLGAGNWTLTQAAGGTFTQTGTASISIPAGLFGLVQGGTFTADPGATVGTGELRFQNASVGAMTLSATTIVAVFQGGVTASSVTNNSGTLIARNNPNSLTDYTSGVGSLLQIDPKDIGAVAALTIANGFTNDGTIDFRESGGGHNTNERLDVTTGAITNSATGVIRSAVGVGTGFHFLGAELVNNGLVEINHRLTIDKSGAAHVNNEDINLVGTGNWTLTQAAGGTFTQTGTATISIPAGLFGLVQGGTFTADPGATVGTGELRFQNASVGAMTLSATTIVAVFQGGVTASSVTNNGGTLIARNNPNSLTDYTSGVGSLLQIDPKDIGAVAALTIANGFTNDGTIDFRESGGGHNTNERLDVTTGAITNSATGVIRSAVGVGTGFHFLGAELVNNGLVEINHRLTIDKSGAAHVNNEDINLLGAGNWTLTQSAAGTFTHLGSISIPNGLFGLVQGGRSTTTPERRQVPVRCASRTAR